MNLRLLCVFLLGLGSPLFASEPYSGELSPAARTRLQSLSRPLTLLGDFTESRFTPLKKTAVIVTGTVRIDRARGLSLTYAQPRAPVVILDEKGLLLRHPDGREQTAPAEATADLRLLHALFVFDLSTLEKSYALIATENPDHSWALVFTRRPEAVSTYRELTLLGQADRLTRIILAKTPRLRTEIALEPPQLDPRFSPEELTRYFR